ncbi:MAG TPA: hypothetical protein PKJ19_13150 [Flavobacteriales bacterium]|nr:hypothetical protein [Flavobacteriales bacterium]HNU57111.1 hypothetical protein [Flavobacteriales bacterium]
MNTEPTYGLYRDHHQNYKGYQIPKAQLIIADIPYNIGKDAYASNPAWYKDGEHSNGESELAGKEFFDTDKDFRPAEFMHFCSTMLRREPKDAKQAPCMIVFCAFEQQFQLIELGKRYTSSTSEHSAQWLRGSSTPASSGSHL